MDEREMNALLGKGSEFDGKLTFEGTVRIDGTFSGEIFTEDTLIVGEGASVTAQIEAGTLIVYGDIEGDVRTKNLLELHAPARLHGNVETASLVIDRGVTFEGSCRMESLATAAAAPAGRAAPAAKAPVVTPVLSAPPENGPAATASVAEN